jgi:hypothetical protein
MALEAIRVIGAPMADAGVAGIGRLTLSRRERMVMVEPCGTGMVVLVTLRAAEENRSPQFATADGAVDAEMLAIARAIIGQRIGKFDAGRFRDRCQGALRELIEAKMKGLPIKPREVPAPAPVIDLMAALNAASCRSRRLRSVLAQGDPPRRHLIEVSKRYFCRVRWPKEEGRASDRTGHSRHKSPKEGLITAAHRVSATVTESGVDEPLVGGATWHEAGRIGAATLREKRRLGHLEETCAHTRELRFAGRDAVQRVGHQPARARHYRLRQHQVPASGSR